MAPLEFSPLPITHVHDNIFPDIELSPSRPEGTSTHFHVLLS